MNEVNVFGGYIQSNNTIFKHFLISISFLANTKDFDVKNEDGSNALNDLSYMIKDGDGREQIRNINELIEMSNSSVENNMK